MRSILGNIREHKLCPCGGPLEYPKLRPELGGYHSKNLNLLSFCAIKLESLVASGGLTVKGCDDNVCR